MTDATGSKYSIEIEGTDYPWEKENITILEVRKLSGLAAEEIIIEIDSDGNERTLTEEEIIILKPGHRYGKKVRYKRG